MTSKKTLRKQVRERMQRLRERQRSAGVKTVTVTLPADVHGKLERIKKERGGTNSTIIEAALRKYAKKICPRAKVIDSIDPGKHPKGTAHFRLNPTTGRREFIKDYDDARHKDEVVLSLVRGDRFQINNPGNEHHGKVVEYTGCSADFETLHGKIDGQPVDFHADRLDRLDRWSDQGQS